MNEWYLPDAESYQCMCIRMTPFLAILHAVIWPRGRPVRKPLLFMRFHGNATRYLALGVCCVFMIPAHGCHVTLLAELWIRKIARVVEAACYNIDLKEVG
jgi:hypothetical protein